MTHPHNPLSGRRLAIHVTGALAVLFGLSAFASLAQVLELTTGVHWNGLPCNRSAPGAAAAGLWLLIRARSHDTATHAWYAAALTAAGIMLVPSQSGAAETGAVVLLAIAGTWLAVTIGQDADLQLWAPWTRDHLSRSSITQATACTLIVIGAHCASSFTYLFGPAPDQGAAMRIDSDLQFAVTALVAGVREEIPMLALIAAAMLAARRPTWQIAAAVGIIRVIPHLYLGLNALGVLVFAGYSLWIYRISGRRLGPIIAAHTIYNGLAALGGAPGRYTLAALALCGFGIAIVRPKLFRPAEQPVSVRIPVQ